MKKYYYHLILLIIFAFALFPGFYFNYFNPRQNSDLTLVLGGDIYCGNRILPEFASHGVDPYINELKQITRSADLHFANLEAPITTGNNPFGAKKYHLHTKSTGVIKLLNILKVDGVSLANNHILDFGPHGMLNTIRHLEDLNIGYAGAGANRNYAEQPAYFHRRGKKVALLSFSNTFPRSFWAGKHKPGTAYGNPDRVKKQVKQIARKSDYLIVSFHWGKELDTQPQKYQRRLAHTSIESGADVVFGHHPHTIQPVEKYQDGIIFYSLGNYFFTTYSRQADYGLLAEVTLGSEKPKDTRLHLFNVNNYQVNFQPELVHSFSKPSHLAAYLQNKNNPRYKLEKFAKFSQKQRRNNGIH